LPTLASLETEVCSALFQW